MVHDKVAERTFRGVFGKPFRAEGDSFLKVGHIRLNADEKGCHFGSAAAAEHTAVRGLVGPAVHGAERLSHIVCRRHCNAGAVTVHIEILPAVACGNDIARRRKQQEWEEYAQQLHNYFCLSHFQRSAQDDFLPKIRMPAL